MYALAPCLCPLCVSSPPEGKSARFVGPGTVLKNTLPEGLKDPRKCPCNKNNFDFCGFSADFPHRKKPNKIRLSEPAIFLPNFPNGQKTRKMGASADSAKINRNSLYGVRKFDERYKSSTGKRLNSSEGLACPIFRPPVVIAPDLS